MSRPRTATRARRQVKKWACHKLLCLGDFIEAYTGTLKDTSCYFLELFATGDNNACNTTECPIDSSELGALATKARFSRYILVARDDRSARNLKRLTTPYNDNISIITGNLINDRVIRQLFDLVPRPATSFALIDPPGYRRLRWSIVKKLAARGIDWQGHKVELLVIFPLEMALLRNLGRRQCEASISRFYGNSLWLDIRQQRLDKKIGQDEARKRLIKLYKTGLKGLGYRYVSDLSPPRFSRSPLYHIIWASDRDGRKEMLKKAWTKPRYLPCELFNSE